MADRAPVLTTGQLRALLRKLCLAADPEDTKGRLQHAVEDRRIVLEANPAGSANLLLMDLPPDVAAAARERIDHLARMLPSDERSMDQRRADVALDLLTGHSKPLGRGMVDLTVDLRTLLGLAEDPGDLAGWGPVVADIARQITDRQTDGRWQATVIDDNGDPFAVAVRRRPSTSQARKSGHGTAPACSPDAADPPDPPTSTTPDATPTVDPPSNGTWHHYANTTTAPKTKAAGDTGADPTATTSGPAPTATPTSPAADPPSVSSRRNAPRTWSARASRRAGTYRWPGRRRCR